MLETPLERGQVCLGFVLDKLYEMDKACRKPNFGTPIGGVKYKPMNPPPVLPSPKISKQHSNILNRKKGEKVSLGAIRKAKDNSSH